MTVYSRRNPSRIRNFSVLQMSITHPDPAYTLSVTGAGDIDLNPSVYVSNYIDALNGYSQATRRGNRFKASQDGRILVKHDSEVIITAYADITHTANNSTVGAVFSIERDGQRILSARAVHAKKPSQQDIGNISGVGASVDDLKLRAGDLITVAFASDKSGTLDIKTSSIVIEGF